MQIDLKKGACLIVEALVVLAIVMVATHTPW